MVFFSKDIRRVCYSQALAEQRGIKVRYFYHISKNVEGILKRGLLPGKAGVWLDSSLKHLTEINARFPLKGGRIFKVDSRLLDERKFRKSKQVILGKTTWWVYRGIIPPEAIKAV